MNLKLWPAKYIFVLTLIFSLGLVNLVPNQEIEAARNITFPVIGKSTYSNDYNAPRDGGSRTHHAIDIIAKKGQPLVAAVSGTIVDVQYPQPYWGYSVTIRDSGGYEYSYLHINDDNPGTNDGAGGGMRAYGPDIREGNKIGKGQLIGWVGDSGRANGISHLHFEMYLPNGKRANPYNSLIQAKKLPRPIQHYPLQYLESLPFGPTFRGGVSVATGNFDADIQQEFIGAVASEGAPTIRVYNHNLTLIKSFNAYSSSFRGGVDVATGDINGDGVDEIIVVPMKGGTPLVRIFNLEGNVLSQFYAYGQGFRHGVKLASGDTDGDGEDEIITGPNANGGPHVKVFEPDGTMTDDFFAYNELFRGGIDVASGDTDGDSIDEIVTSPGPRGGPHVKVFEPDGTMNTEFFAYNDQFRGGVRVSVGKAYGFTNDVIATVPASFGGPSIKLFRGNSSPIISMHFLEGWWKGAYDVALGDGEAKVGTGYNRRSAIKTVVFE